MRDGCNPPVLFDEFDGLDGRKSFSLAIRLRTGFQIGVESVVYVLAIPFFHKFARHVHTAEPVRRKIDIELDSEVLQFLSDADVSFLSQILNFLQFLHKIGVFVVDIIS